MLVFYSFNSEGYLGLRLPPWTRITCSLTAWGRCSRARLEIRSRARKAISLSTKKPPTVKSPPRSGLIVATSCMTGILQEAARDKSHQSDAPRDEKRGETDKMDSAQVRALSVNVRLNLPVQREPLASSRGDLNARRLLLSRPSPASGTHRSSAFPFTYVPRRTCPGSPA